MTCNKCNKTGHIARECPEQSQSSMNKCHRCGQVGHKGADCPNPVYKRCGEHGHLAIDCPGTLVQPMPDMRLAKDDWGGPSTNPSAGPLLNFVLPKALVVVADASQR
ncbi:hypothetical protein V8F33_004568 [Rhypophila sp. PSN 637]